MTLSCAEASAVVGASGWISGRVDRVEAQQSLEHGHRLVVGAGRHRGAILRLPWRQGGARGRGARTAGDNPAPRGRPV
jgi:hypothetical protein